MTTPVLVEKMSEKNYRLYLGIDIGELKNPHRDCFSDLTLDWYKKRQASNCASGRGMRFRRLLNIFKTI